MLEKIKNHPLRIALLAVLCGAVIAALLLLSGRKLESTWILVVDEPLSLVSISDGLSAEIDGNRVNVSAAAAGEYEIVLETQSGERFAEAVIFKKNGDVEWRELEG